MYYRCDLSVGGYLYDVTNDVKNWDDVKSSIKRSDYDGAVRSFTNQFEFVNDAYVLLLNEYRTNMLESSAMVIFYTRTNSWEWKEEFRRKLDVSTLSYDGSTLSVNAIDDGVATIIKAKKGTQYEYSVKNYKEKEPLKYEGILIEDSVKYSITGDKYYEPSPGVISPDEGAPIITAKVGAYTYFPQFVENEDVSVNNSIVYTDSGTGVIENAENVNTGEGMSPFIECIKDTSVFLSMKFNLPILNGYSYHLYIRRMGKDKTYTDVYDLLVSKGSGIYKQVDFNNYEIPLKKGDVLYAYIHIVSEGILAPNIDMMITGERLFKVSWYDRISPISIDIVKPITLLNCLLTSMNSGNDGITGTIDTVYDSRLKDCVLLPAESIRGIAEAKMYSSFSKFCDWMRTVFGYVYYIDGSMVNFVHRSKLFDGKIIKTIKNATRFKYTVNKSLIYSQVNAGYDKQDYDSVNGRYEWNFTNYYTTGIEVTDSKYELKSPLRADCYGIEFLADTRGQDTTDKDSDNDMFFTIASVSGSYYNILRTIQVGGVPDGCFNGEFSPMYCIKANEGFIGAFARSLSYASSDGNTDVVIDGKNANEDLNIGKRLFTVGEIEFETNEIEIPEDWNGVVELSHDGIEYSGFISSANVTYTKEEATTYNLIEKSIK